MFSLTDSRPNSNKGKRTIESECESVLEWSNERFERALKNAETTKYTTFALVRNRNSSKWDKNCY